MTNPFPAPLVPEAQNGTLDLAGVEGVTIRIPPYPGMNAGDKVSVRLEGTDKPWEDFVLVTPSAVGRDIFFEVPHHTMTEGDLQITYSVQRAKEGTPTASETLTIHADARVASA